MARRVASASGVKYYGLPLGSLITPDIIAKAREANGGKPAPRGASRSASATRKVPTPPKGMPPRPGGPAKPKEVDAPGAPEPTAADSKKSPAEKPARVPAKAADTKLSGPRKLYIGDKEYGVPEDSRVLAPRLGNKPVAYVIADGDVHVLTEQGEVELDAETKRSLQSRLLTDTKYIAEIPAASEDALSSATPDDERRREALNGEAAKKSKPASKTEEPADEPRTNLETNDAGRIQRNVTSTGTAPTPDAGEIDAMKVSPYTSKHLNPDGTFTEERLKVHEQIINDFLAGIEPVENPTQYMNGGGPASGKGTMTKGKNAELTKYPTSRGVDDLTGELDASVETPQALLIDPDAIKMQLPEVKEALARLNSGDVEQSEDMMWAGNSHEESSQLAKRLHAAALERGVNIIYDGTGNSSVDSVTKKVKLARDAGFRVEANYLYLDPTEGVNRAATRAARSKRIVPDAQIKKTYASLPEIFDGIKTGVFDKINLFDNNVPFGQPAKLIGQGGGDEFNLIDSEAYQRYLDSGARAREALKKAKTTPLQDDLATTDSAKKSQRK
jgi:predicted ABC-type ATPase